MICLINHNFILRAFINYWIDTFTFTSFHSLKNSSYHIIKPSQKYFSPSTALHNNSPLIIIHFNRTTKLKLFREKNIRNKSLLSWYHELFGEKNIRTKSLLSWYHELFEKKNLEKQYNHKLTFINKIVLLQN